VARKLRQGSRAFVILEEEQGDEPVTIRDSAYSNPIIKVFEKCIAVSGGGFAKVSLLGYSQSKKLAVVFDCCCANATSRYCSLWLCESRSCVAVSMRPKVIPVAGVKPDHGHEPWKSIFACSHVLSKAPKGPI
jgi:hypothetical protein